MLDIISSPIYVTLLTFQSIWGTVLTALVHVVFAVAVYRDATHLDRRHPVAIVGPKGWCIELWLAVS